MFYWFPNGKPEGLRIDINFEKEIINVLIIVSNFVNHSLVVNELNVFFQSHVILT